MWEFFDAWVEDVLLQKGAAFTSASWNNLKISSQLETFHTACVKGLKAM